MKLPKLSLGDLVYVRYLDHCSCTAPNIEDVDEHTSIYLYCVGFVVRITDDIIYVNSCGDNYFFESSDHNWESSGQFHGVVKKGIVSLKVFSNLKKIDKELKWDKLE